MSHHCTKHGVSPMRYRNVSPISSDHKHIGQPNSALRTTASAFYNATPSAIDQQQSSLRRTQTTPMLNSSSKKSGYLNEEGTSAIRAQEVDQSRLRQEIEAREHELKLLAQMDYLIGLIKNLEAEKPNVIETAEDESKIDELNRLTSSFHSIHEEQQQLQRSLTHSQQLQRSVINQNAEAPPSLVSSTMEQNFQSQQRDLPPVEVSHHSVQASTHSQQELRQSVQQEPQEEPLELSNAHQLIQSQLQSVEPDVKDLVVSQIQAVVEEQLPQQSVVISHRQEEPESQQTAQTHLLQVPPSVVIVPVVSENGSQNNSFQEKLEQDSERIANALLSSSVNNSQIQQEQPSANHENPNEENLAATTLQLQPEQQQQLTASLSTGSVHNDLNLLQSVASNQGDQNIEVNTVTTQRNDLVDEVVISIPNRVEQLEESVRSENQHTQLPVVASIIQKVEEFIEDTLRTSAVDPQQQIEEKQEEIKEDQSEQEVIQQVEDLPEAAPEPEQEQQEPAEKQQEEENSNLEESQQPQQQELQKSHIAPNLEVEQPAADLTNPEVEASQQLNDASQQLNESSHVAQEQLLQNQVPENQVEPQSAVADVAASQRLEKQQQQDLPQEDEQQPAEEEPQIEEDIAVLQQSVRGEKQLEEAQPEEVPEIENELALKNAELEQQLAEQQRINNQQAEQIQELQSQLNIKEQQAQFSALTVDQLEKELASAAAQLQVSRESHETEVENLKAILLEEQHLSDVERTKLQEQLLGVQDDLALVKVNHQREVDENTHLLQQLDELQQKARQDADVAVEVAAKLDQTNIQLSEANQQLNQLSEITAKERERAEALEQQLEGLVHEMQSLKQCVVDQEIKNESLTIENETLKQEREAGLRQINSLEEERETTNLQIQALIQEREGLQEQAQQLLQTLSQMQDRLQQQEQLQQQQAIVNINASTSLKQSQQQSVLQQSISQLKQELEVGSTKLDHSTHLPKENRSQNHSLHASQRLKESVTAAQVNGNEQINGEDQEQLAEDDCADCEMCMLEEMINQNEHLKEQLLLKEKEIIELKTNPGYYARVTGFNPVIQMGRTPVPSRPVPSSSSQQTYLEANNSILQNRIAVPQFESPLKTLKSPTQGQSASQSYVHGLGSSATGKVYQTTPSVPQTMVGQSPSQRFTSPKPPMVYSNLQSEIEHLQRIFDSKCKEVESWKQTYNQLNL